MKKLFCLLLLIPMNLLFSYSSIQIPRKNGSMDLKIAFQGSINEAIKIHCQNPDGLEQNIWGTSTSFYNEFDDAQKYYSLGGEIGLEYYLNYNTSLYLGLSYDRRSIKFEWIHKMDLYCGIIICS